MESDVICISSEDEKSEPRRKVTKEKIENISPINKVNKITNGISSNGVNKIYTIKSAGNLTKDKVNQILKTNGVLQAAKETKVVDKNTEAKMNVPIVQSPIFKTGEVSIIKRKINDDSDTSTPTVKRIKLTTLSTTTTIKRTSSDEKITNDIKINAENKSNDNKKLENENTSKTTEREASPTPGCSWFPEVQKPQLIIKEKKSLYDDEFDLFTTFLETCLKKDSTEDMKKIIKKLKNRHERLNPSFLNGPVFKQLLIDKQKVIDLNDDKLYSHITEVNDEMKNAEKNNVLEERKNVKEEKIIINNNEHEDKDEEDSHEEKRKRRKAREILSRIESVKKRIKQLEMQEVEFSDESESTYLVEDRYKKKLMQLWSAYCKYTGKAVDAGRTYLRPRDISATQIQKVDQAIMNFINSKISRRNELMKKGKSIRDTIIFPDYVDILNCISQCNEKQNLRLTRSEQETKAKEAFEKIGVYLQRCRQRDYWDTFSIFLDEEDDDPSLKDPELLEKLNQNEALGNRKMENLFEEFAAKQNNIGDQKNANDSESESVDSNDDEDDKENPDDSAKKDDQAETEIDDDSSKEENENNSSNKENAGKEDSDKNSNKSNNEKKIIEENKTNEEILTNESTMSADEINSNQSLTGNKSISKSSLSEVKETDADVIDIDDESNVDKQPLVRLRSFAKPPTSWKDSQGDGSTLLKKYVTITEKLSPTTTPIIRKFVTSTPKACTILKASSSSSSSASPALVDLTSEKKDESKLSTTINKSKTVMLPSNFKGKQIISVKNITNNYNVRVNQVPEKIIPMKVIPKTVNSNQIVGNKQIIYHSNGNGKILNPLGKIVRLKIPQNSDTKVMKVLNLNEATQKVSMVIPMKPIVQKPRVTQKHPINSNSNQVNEQASKISRYDHQYSKKIVNNIVRIIKPTDQLDKVVTLKKT
ncbi:bromodomain-containing protein DDB_G0270170-like [Leptopilina heterotoma]|uniref:bromodomain-containing protein DDB_G0270170-like n=1 Tax=Leptopilina heterotoma TaxID=63436 RepID=UPI001CA807CF|nr:bromodomain-containing protein DDB_G0270170-like [Leptopilina heterotoma]